MPTQPWEDQSAYRKCGALELVLPAELQLIVERALCEHLQKRLVSVTFYLMSE
jgi:hypothetical protein